MYRARTRQTKKLLQRDVIVPTKSKHFWKKQARVKHLYKSKKSLPSARALFRSSRPRQRATEERKKMASRVNQLHKPVHGTTPANRPRHLQKKGRRTHWPPSIFAPTHRTHHLSSGPVQRIMVAGGSPKRRPCQAHEHTLSPPFHEKLHNDGSTLSYSLRQYLCSRAPKVCTRCTMMMGKSPTRRPSAKQQNLLHDHKTTSSNSRLRTGTRQVVSLVETIRRSTWRLLPREIKFVPCVGKGFSCN